MDLTTIADIAGTFNALPGFLSILNVAILLFAIFFFTSTLSSHLLEYWAGLRNTRGVALQERLEAALGSGEIYQTPLIKSLSDKKSDSDTTTPPSYIEPEFLAQAIINKYYPLSNGTRSEQSAPAVVKQLYEEAGQNDTAFESRIIEWFKALNERQNGKYTRWSFFRLFVIGLLFSVAMDIDTIHITSTLWSKPEIAEKLVVELEKSVPNLKDGDPSKLGDEDKQKLQDALLTIWPSLRSDLEVVPLYAWQSLPQSESEWGAKALGWLLTALATSLGAQFWFNLLSEAFKLRAAGRKPDEGKTSGKSDTKNKGSDKPNSNNKASDKEEEKIG